MACAHQWCSHRVLPFAFPAWPFVTADPFPLLLAPLSSWMEPLLLLAQPCYPTLPETSKPLIETATSLKHCPVSLLCRAKPLHFSTFSTPS